MKLLKKKFLDFFYFLCDFLEFFFRYFLHRRDKRGFLESRNDVNVSVRNLQTMGDIRYESWLEGFLYLLCCSKGKLPVCSKVGYIVYPTCILLGYYEGMSHTSGEYIEEGEEVLILVYSVAWCLALYNIVENSVLHTSYATRYNRETQNTSKNYYYLSFFCMNIHVPADVPSAIKSTYTEHYEALTHGSGNLMLFAGDQKVEHLNKDFFGEGVTEENNTPEHMFRIASKAKIGAFASQLGLIARYAPDYRDVPYLVKMNSKTNLVPVQQAESKSYAWVTLDQVAEFKRNSQLNILGVGYTVYVGSENETYMFQEAADLIYEAHQHGLIAVLWMYPRGKAVPEEKHPDTIAGAAGVGACLGADFVKVNYPQVEEGESRAQSLRQAVLAAGRTKVICAGGASTDPRAFLQDLHDQIHISGAHGNATGRNFHQRPLNEAVGLCNAAFGVTVEGKSVDEVWGS